MIVPRGSSAADGLSVGLRRFEAVELLRGGCVVCRGPGPALCAACLRRTEPPPVTRVRDVGPVPALFAYAGHGARVVQSLKYRDGRRLVAPLADALALRCPVAPGGDVMVTWVPTSARRRRARGFDQSELLARALARRLGAPCAPLLRRRPGPAQTGLDRAGRATAARYLPVARAGRPVVLVDDVCTTGATLRAARSALEDGGATLAGCVVVARTP
jgi:predicted amidophosphoribosyltransferase